MGELYYNISLSSLRVIPLINHDTVRENSEVVIIYPDISWFPLPIYIYTHYITI